MGNHSAIDLDDAFKELGINIPDDLSMKQLRELSEALKTIQQEQELIAEVKRIIAQK